MSRSTPPIVAAHCLVGTITVTELAPLASTQPGERELAGVVAAALGPRRHRDVDRQAAPAPSVRGELRSARERRRRADRDPVLAQARCERGVLERRDSGSRPPTSRYTARGDRQRRAGEVMMRGTRVELPRRALSRALGVALVAAADPGRQLGRLVVELDQPGDRAAPSARCDRAAAPASRARAASRRRCRRSARGRPSSRRRLAAASIPGRRAAPAPAAGPSISVSWSPSAWAALPGGARPVSSVQRVEHEDRLEAAGCDRLRRERLQAPGDVVLLVARGDHDDAQLAPRRTLARSARIRARSPRRPRGSARRRSARRARTRP